MKFKMIIICLGLLSLGLIQIFANIALGEEGSRLGSQRLLQIEEEISILNPFIEENRLKYIAEAIEYCSDEYNVPEKLLIAVANRESHFDYRVETGQKRGAAGEVGLCQTNPRHLINIPKLIPLGCRPGLIITKRHPEKKRMVYDGPRTAHCQMCTSAAIHRYFKNLCGGSWWVAVASYGQGKCVTEAEARRHRGARHAFLYFREIGGESW